MKFSKEQQEVIDSLINKRVAEVRAKAEAKAAEVVTATEAPAELNRPLSEALNKLRIAEIKAAAATLGAFNPSQVATLMDSTIKVDALGNLFVVDSDGVRQFTKDGAPLPVGSAVAAFLTANPNHVKASGSQGAGSQGSTGFFGGVARVLKRWQYDKLSPTERMERILDGATVVD